MRIVAGAFGGQTLRAPRGSRTRPTTDRVREALFSILRHAVVGSQVLDLFAGAGTLGLEALSRGATSAVFVDRDRLSIACIKSNIAHIGVESQCQVLPLDAFRAIDRLARQGRLFRLIFIDPPYHTQLATQTLQQLTESRLLTDDGIVIIEHDRRCPPASQVESLVRTDCRRYGDTEISLYQQRK